VTRNDDDDDDDDDDNNNNNNNNNIGQMPVSIMIKLKLSHYTP
jgi:hypothetical protein